MRIKTTTLWPAAYQVMRHSRLSCTKELKIINLAAYITNLLFFKTKKARLNGETKLRNLRVCKKKIKQAHEKILPGFRCFIDDFGGTGRRVCTDAP
jgi:hypothetical protein